MMKKIYKEIFIFFILIFLFLLLHFILPQRSLISADDAPTLTPTCAPPAAPDPISVTANNDKPTVNLTDPTRVCMSDQTPVWHWTDHHRREECSMTNTRIYRSWILDEKKKVLVFGSNKNEWELPSDPSDPSYHRLSHNDKVFIRASFKNAGGWGGWSNIVSNIDGVSYIARAQIDLRVPTPSGLSITCNSSSVDFSWNTITDLGCAGLPDNPYKAQIATDASFSNIVVDGAWTNGTSLSYSSPACDLTYYARVRAQDAVGNESGWSESVSCFLSCEDGVPSPTATPTPTPTCAKKQYGDANCDDKIDGVDYSMWLNRQCTDGCSAANLVADFDGNEKVNDVDYHIWFDNRQ